MQEIIKYFKGLGLPSYILEKNINSFEKNSDIAKEFEVWLKSGEYNKIDPIRIQGYTAEDIFKIADFLDGAGAYNLLITLRERPEKGLKYIHEGFKMK